MHNFYYSSVEEIYSFLKPYIMMKTPIKAKMPPPISTTVHAFRRPSVMNRIMQFLGCAYKKTKPPNTIKKIPFNFRFIVKN